ncbi:MAG: plastocyanin/azurin family copper-binding protein [Pseudomonadota bacterium]|nr:plastocyanin/azurin family copper-binding protein [Pseudomonadota bacterium]
MRRRILAAAPLALLASPATAGTDDDAEAWITLGASGAISKSTVLDTGDQFSFTFTKPGQFEYFCSLHPKMTSRVTVVK